MSTPASAIAEGRPRSVSIALATYNGGAFIDALLRSLAAQSHRPDELVVCDDGSTDDTLDRVRAFAVVAPFPVHVFENGQRFGYRQNFMRAGARCISDVIFFCDQDDEWLPTKIERMAVPFDDPRVLLAYHNAMVVGPQGEALFALYDDAEERRAVDPHDPEPFHFSLGFTQAYRRGLHAFDDLWPASLDHIAPTAEPLAHDQWFFFVAMLLGVVSYVSEPLVHYRQHGANVYGVRDTDRRNVLLARWRSAVLAPAYADRSKAASASSRGRTARAVATRVDDQQPASVLVRAEAYECLAGRLQRRHDSAYAGRLSARIDALWDNVLSLAYRGGDRLHFSPRWLIGDTLRTLRGATEPRQSDRR